MKNLSKNNSDKNNDNNTAELGVYNQKKCSKINKSKSFVSSNEKHFIL